MPKKANLSDPTTDTQIQKVRDLEKEISVSKRNTWNSIDKIQAKLSEPATEAPVLFASLKSLERVFAQFIADPQFRSDSATSVTLVYDTKFQPREFATTEEESDDKDRKKKAKTEKKVGPRDTLQDEQDLLRGLDGMRVKYNKFIESVVQLLQHETPGIQVPALATLMNFVQAESQLKAEQKGTKLIMDFYLFDHFAPYLFEHANDNQSEELLDSFTETYLLPYDDVRFATVATINRLVSSFLESKKKQNNSEQEEAFARSVFEIFERITIPSELSEMFIGELPLEPEEEEEEPFLDDDEDDPKKKRKREEDKKKKEQEKKKKLKETPQVHQLVAHKRLFERAWMQFFKLSIPFDVYKSILKAIEDVISGFNNPARLLDFLKESYDKGGVVSVLSLNGVFLLIHNHNLDYPDFYKKLYALFEPSLFYSKYRNRFWRLANVFMGSTYLPSYLVAAFAKRCARLMLRAPPSGCITMMAFIYSLLQRHPQCRILVSRPPKEKPKQVLLINAGPTVDQGPLEQCEGFDPYLPNEPDPAKANAFDSCLWELSAMENHYCPEVSRVYGLFKGCNFDRALINMEEYMNYSYDSLIDTNLNKKAKVELAFQVPKMLFAPTDPFDGWILPSAQDKK